MSDVRARLTAGTLFVLTALATARAAAHPAPAIPPSFVPGECITVIDTRETQLLQLGYDVAVDDNVFGDGEIHLPDAKTHQFFSLAGLIVKSPTADGYQLFPFDAAIEQPIALPLWLDQSDVNRAAAAVGPADMTGFTASQVDAGDVLALRTDLAPHVQAIDGGAARVPITKRQAEKGVHWDLRAAAPGLYSVVGYVFSPPYNDWAARAGIIKLVDGRSAIPAAVLEPVDKIVFAGQGRRVKGCFHAPTGSTLSAWVRAEDQPDAPWEAWLQREPLALFGKDGAFELCFLNREPGRAGVLRVRVEITAPDGQRSAAYSPDTLLAVATAAPCTPSEDTCCAMGALAADAGRELPSATPSDAGVAAVDERPEAGGGLDAGQQVAPRPSAPSAGGDVSPGEGSGCALRAGEASDASWLLLALLGLAIYSCRVRD